MVALLAAAAAARVELRETVHEIEVWASPVPSLPSSSPPRSAWLSIALYPSLATVALRATLANGYSSVYLVGRPDLSRSILIARFGCSGLWT